MTSILQNKQGVPSAPVSTQWATSRLWIYTRGLLWLVGIRFGLRLLLVTLAWHRGDPSPVVDFLFDDSYLYAVVARNFAATGVSTFDGVTLTNGYQPLWFLLHVYPSRQCRPIGSRTQIVPQRRSNGPGHLSDWTGPIDARCGGCDVPKRIRKGAESLVSRMAVSQIDFQCNEQNPDLVRSPAWSEWLAMRRSPPARRLGSPRS